MKKQDKQKHNDYKHSEIKNNKDIIFDKQINKS